MTLPRSFTEVAGWREAFRAAAKRLDEVRVGSLFTSLTLLCGEPVRAFCLRDWAVLDQAGNTFVAGGMRETMHALKVIWLVHDEWQPRGKKADKAQMAMMRRVMLRYKGDEFAILKEVEDYLDDAFLDMPGRYSEKKGGCGPTNWPRMAYEVEACAEIMSAFPSFRFEELFTMPLAQFWQWLNAARRKADPEYRNYQETDAVNARALRVVNEAKRELASRN